MTEQNPPAAPEEMSDAELVEAVATEVMGCEDGGGHWWCPKCEDWVHGAQVSFAQVHRREGCGETVRAYKEIEEGWNSLSSDKDARDILDRMRSHWGCTFSIRLLSTGKTVVEFLDHHGMIVGQYRHRDHLKALCIAALHAVRSSPSPNA